MSTLVRFPAYRHYDEMRRGINDSVMGLLAGAGLASHLLNPMVHANVPLAMIFPDIDQISRFDLSIDKAREVLGDSGQHVARMAIPYTLALHEDYMKRCLELLVADGKVSASQANSTSASKMHELLERACPGSFPRDSLSQFHVLREMRNCLIHRAGKVDGRFVATVATWNSGAEAGWVKQVGHSPRRLSNGSHLQLSVGEVVMAFAVSKLMARSANQMLLGSVNMSTWVDVVIRDLQEFGPGVPANKDERLRKLQGYARHLYAPLGLSEPELLSGLSRAGY
ncbi:hypothetical protein ACIQWR_40580 [Streptomyces sp. NPDC098789]|uniref:hypothetical protein n=1 Tax=Streptomyces sp. NPDC098789 TaxID=3366098 RepID=UPI00381C0042